MTNRFRSLRAALMLAFAVSAVPALAATTQPADLPVKAVTLYTSGVGFFRHSGTFNGDGTVSLKFKAEQINDVIKSLVVQSDGGRVSGVQYPSQDPLDKTLKTFQIDLSQDNGLPALLGQIRGAKVTIELAGNDSRKGTVLGVEQRPVVADNAEKPVFVWRVNLFDGTGLSYVELDKIKSLKLDDPTLAGELNQALAALAAGRDQDKKPVTLTYAGQGQHGLRVGYVVQTPVWKVTYRLLLGDEAEAGPTKPGRPVIRNHMQGWAVVENQTDSDWNDVQLSLVSGRPISFQMDLYQPIYLERPTAELDLFRGLKPQVYYGGGAAQNAAFAGNRSVDTARRKTAGQALRSMAAPAAIAPEMADMAASQRQDLAFSGKLSELVTAANTARLGALFQFTIDHVSLPRQQSSLVPIVTDDVQAEPLSIYNETVLPRNPLTGVMLTNTTGKMLPQGPITVLQSGTYAGDAQIEDLPAGQKRLLSFGVDLETLVTVTNDGRADLVGGKVVKGILVLSRRQSQGKAYAVENKSEKDRGVIVEHPLLEGWALVDTPTPLEQTDKRYRFKLDVAKGKSETLKVTQQRTVEERLQLLDADLGGLIALGREGAIPEKVKAAIAEAIKRRQTVVDLERQAQEKQQAIDAIGQEQNRLRENMRIVEKDGPYYARLLAKLNEQESRIEGLQKEKDDLTDKAKAAREAFEKYLQDLNVG